MFNISKINSARISAFKRIRSFIKINIKNKNILLYIMLKHQNIISNQYLTHINKQNQPQVVVLNIPNLEINKNNKNNKYYVNEINKRNNNTYYLKIIGIN